MIILHSSRAFFADIQIFLVAIKYKTFPNLHPLYANYTICFSFLEPYFCLFQNIFSQKLFSCWNMSQS